MYAILCGGIEKKTVKVVKKSVFRDEIRMEDYIDCLNNDKVFRHKMKRQQTNKHKTTSIKLEKVSLSFLDDKRYILPDKINTLAFGHYKINS